MTPENDNTNPNTDPLPGALFEGDRDEVRFGGREGWVCPRCGAANAPWVSQCGCSPAVTPRYPSHPGWPTSPGPGDSPQPWWNHPPVVLCCGGPR